MPGRATRSMPRSTPRRWIAALALLGLSRCSVRQPARGPRDLSAAPRSRPAADAAVAGAGWPAGSCGDFAVRHRRRALAPPPCNATRRAADRRGALLRPAGLAVGADRRSSTGGRVALGDEIGGALGADMVAVLIGERPGLSAADCLGVYLTWQPAPGRGRCGAQLHLQHPARGDAGRRGGGGARGTVRGGAAASDDRGGLKPAPGGRG